MQIKIPYAFQNKSLPNNILIFFSGAAVGSFLNVLASRYSEKTGFKKALRGRSHCNSCKRTLCWYELVPVLSFVFLRGKCNSCSKRIPVLYTLVEILAGLIAILVPIKIGFTPFAVVWVLVFWVLLLMSIIDLRLKVIPNPPVVLIALLGLINLAYRYSIGPVGSSYVATPGADLLGYYSMVLKFGFSPLTNHLIAVIVGYHSFFDWFISWTTYDVG